MLYRVSQLSWNLGCKVSISKLNSVMALKTSFSTVSFAGHCCAGRLQGQICVALQLPVPFIHHYIWSISAEVGCTFGRFDSERRFSHLPTSDGAGETPEHVWNRFKAGTNRVWLFFFLQMELRKTTRWKKSLGGSDKLQRKVDLNKHEWQKMEHREAKNKKWGNEMQNGLSKKFTDNNLPLSPPNTDFTSP